jgi:hypothetical protein
MKPHSGSPKRDELETKEKGCQEEKPWTKWNHFMTLEFSLFVVHLALSLTLPFQYNEGSTGCT